MTHHGVVVREKRPQEQKEWVIANVRHSLSPPAQNKPPQPLTNATHTHTHTHTHMLEPNPLTVISLASHSHRLSQKVAEGHMSLWRYGSFPAGIGTGERPRYYAALSRFEGMKPLGALVHTERKTYHNVCIMYNVYVLVYLLVAGQTLHGQGLR